MELNEERKALIVQNEFICSFTGETRCTGSGPGLNRNTSLKKHLLQKLFATQKKLATDCFVDLTLFGDEKIQLFQ